MDEHNTPDVINVEVDSSMNSGCPFSSVHTTLSAYAHVLHICAVGNYILGRFVDPLCRRLHYTYGHKQLIKTYVTLALLLLLYFP